MTQEFKNARDFIKEIQIFPSNLEYILQTGVINGSLLASIQTAINAHSQQYIDTFDAIDAMKNDRIKDLQQSNKELVEMLERVLSEDNCTPDTDKEITELITKHKQS